MGRGTLGFIGSAGQNAIGDLGSLHLSALPFSGSRLCSQAAPLKALTCSSLRRSIHTLNPQQRRPKSPSESHLWSNFTCQGSLGSPRSKSVLASLPYFITGWKPPWEAKPQVLRDCQSVRVPVAGELKKHSLFLGINAPTDFPHVLHGSHVRV